jgi:hypothetical protein
MRSDAGEIPLLAPDPEHQRDQDGHGGDNQEYALAYQLPKRKRRTRTVRSGNGSTGSAD